MDLVALREAGGVVAGGLVGVAVNAHAGEVRAGDRFDPGSQLVRQPIGERDAVARRSERRRVRTARGIGPRGSFFGLEAPRRAVTAWLHR
jgi:hypothetical protein